MPAGVRLAAGIVASYLLFAGMSNGQQLARNFFDNTVMHEVRIDVDPDDWASLKQNYLEDTYYHANVFSGSLAAYSVGIRSRGRGSRSPLKPNLDVNIQKYAKKQTFAGLRYFILKANNQDASMMHEAVAFQLYRRMGLPAPREAPAKVYINDQYLGLYTIVEHEDEDFLNRNLGEDGGDLFEWKPAFNYNFEDLGDDPAAYMSLLDPKTDNPSYAKFMEMVKAINYSSQADFVDSVSRYLDLKLYLTLAATENAIAEIDGLWESVYGTNNIYLYRFQAQDLFHLLTWDKDLTFWQTLRPLPEGQNNMLVRRLLDIPEYRSFYLSQLAKTADLMGGAGGWADQEVTRLYSLIHDAAINDPNKQCIQLAVARPPEPCGADAFERGVRDLRDFIAARAGFVMRSLAQQRYQLPTDPAIGSVTLMSYEAGTDLVPGSIITLRGINFGPDTASSGLPLPRTVGRSFVAIDGVRAPIVSVAGSEAHVQIPWDIPTGKTSIALSANGQLSNTIDAPVVSAAPAILSVLHADGTPVNGDHPARAGEPITIYATGLGAVEADIASGTAPPIGSLIRTIETPSLAVGTAQATVLFAGLSPGSVGLYQINAVMPVELVAGEVVTLSVSAEGTTSSARFVIGL